MELLEIRDVDHLRFDQGKYLRKKTKAIPVTGRGGP
jgi:hypothetical protein